MIIILYLFFCVLLLLFFSHCSYSLIYIHFLYLPLFNFAFLVFLFFLFFLFHTMLVSFCFLCFIHQLALWFGLVFRFVYQLVLLLIGRYHFWYPLPAKWISGTFFSLGCFGFVCMCICMFLCFCCFLSDFISTICLGFLALFFCFYRFVLIHFNAITNGLWNLSSLTRDQA